MPRLHTASPSPNPVVKIGNVSVSNRLPLALFARPCQLESRMHALEMAAALKEIADKLRIGVIYKTSFDKANRTSAGAAQRGIGRRPRCPSSPNIGERSACPS